MCIYICIRTSFTFLYQFIEEKNECIILLIKIKERKKRVRVRERKLD